MIVGFLHLCAFETRWNLGIAYLQPLQPMILYKEITVDLMMVIFIGVIVIYILCIKTFVIMFEIVVLIRVIVIYIFEIIVLIRVIVVYIV